VPGGINASRQRFDVSRERLGAMVNGGCRASSGHFVPAVKKYIGTKWRGREFDEL
jgi:hypothetical protein